MTAPLYGDTQFIYSFFCQRASGLFPGSGNYEESYLRTDFLCDLSFPFSWVYNEDGIPGHIRT